MAVAYRRFRNDDAPAVVEIWNESFTGRGTVRLRGGSALEEPVLAKPYFDPAGLIVAEEDGRRLGFAHAGFGPNEAETDLDTTAGVACLAAVRPQQRRRGIGSELVRRAEAYLRERGARTVYFGSHWPLTPFYFGLYGGSGAPGILDSEGAEGFLTRLQYRPQRRFTIWQRSLAEPVKVNDARLVTHRLNYALHVAPPRRRTWWQECVFSVLDMQQFVVEDKRTRARAAAARVWDMEGYSLRWSRAALGIFDLEVQPALHRRGLAKFLLALLLRHFQEQFIEVVEVQTEDSNAAAAALCQGLGFERVDSGCVWVK